MSLVTFASLDGLSLREPHLLPTLLARLLPRLLVSPLLVLDREPEGFLVHQVLPIGLVKDLALFLNVFDLLRFIVLGEDIIVFEISVVEIQYYLTLVRGGFSEVPLARLEQRVPFVSRTFLLLAMRIGVVFGALHRVDLIDRQVPQLVAHSHHHWRLLDVAFWLELMR